MKAKELLKEIVKAYPDVVAIARDEDGDCYGYFDYMPLIKDCGEWSNYDRTWAINFSKIIEWDSENWKENIVTINDLENESN